MNNVLLILLFGYSLVSLAINSNQCEDITMVEEIVLDESTHFIGSAKLNIDHYGNIIITDINLKNVKLFDMKGELITVLGQEGRGPGDFEAPVHTIRQDSLLYTIELHGKLTIWDLNSGNVISIMNLPLFGINKFIFFDENHIIANGRYMGETFGSDTYENYRLHLINIETGDVVKSFFKLPDEYKFYLPITTVIPGLINFHLYDNGIIANQGLGNHIFEFNNDLELINSYEVPIDPYFDSILDNIHDFNSIDIYTLLTSFSRIEQIFRVSEYGYFIQISKNIDFDKETMSVDERHWFLYADIKNHNLCKIKVDGSASIVENNNLFIFNEMNTSVQIYNFK